MRFHREGYNTIVITGVAALGLLIIVILLFPDAVAWHFITAGLGIIFLVAILQFFRHPGRLSPEGGRLVLAPADGKVVVIEETTETEYLKDRRIQVSIFMSPVNVHVNRCPVSGRVKHVRYFQGKYLVAWHPKSSTENERTTIVIEHGSGVEVLFRQIAGAMARRIRWYLKEGQEVSAGEEMGFIKFGSRMDVFLPPGTKINVTLGQKVRGGETVLAEL
ncbi:phosphatidylserine decarboxylase [Anseongella ginsenosidimutans]|uniref:Phosphatidylserine decarboxylase proenzyme n=1 Tax=Anseongella ginsenosidimutans TaxID=496056 RepID=A0A4R3KUT8_9SPHI|nr:phosphatidylserine decarboxylase family protein [Anseongella ginsenosidimutans]QEC51573.1 phosphatidylserine decarboxylase family protein [Anseongella ginsenosidimutans]TCS88898.1 phosphatidylserine decarboxylase [Anseongella ginsenosidimutans]